MLKIKSYFIALLVCFSFLGLQAQTKSLEVTITALKSKLSNESSNQNKVDIQVELAENYLFSNSDSLKYFANEAFALSKKIEYQKGLGKSYNLLGFVAQNENDFKKAIENFKSANAIFKELKDEASQASTLHNLGGIYIRIRELESSKKILLESLELSEKVNDTKTLAKTTYQLGNLEKASRNFDKALEYYQKSLKSAESLNDKTSIGNAYGGIGLVYDATKDYTKAIEYLKKSVGIFRGIGNTQNLSVLLSNLGSVYYEIEDFENSKKCLEEALKIKRKIGSNRSTAMTLGAVGNLYASMKKFDKAKMSYNEAITMLPEQDKETKFGLLYMIGLQDYEQKNYLEAKTYFDKALLISKTANIDKGSMSELLKTYALTQEKLDDYQSALITYKKASELKDSLNTAQNNDKINELKTQFEIVEKEKKIATLNIENKNKELIVAKKERQTQLLLIGILATLAMLILLFYGYKSKQKVTEKLQLANNELNTNKIELEQALKEKEVLLKEVHHRVKNNLQLVLSLLNIQAREAKNQDVDLFLEKGEARIASMALIHQTLYTSDKISKVDIKMYLEKLLDSIYTSFDIDREKFKYEITTKPLDFDLQTAVPLGLIINELACNALKHAFINKEEGILKISLQDLEKGFELKVADNGVGIKNEKESSNSVGLELVSTLTQQLNGTLKTIVNNGTTFILNFSEIAMPS